MKLGRRWVSGFVLVLVVFGAAQLEAWPLTSWYMFSHVEPDQTRIARAVAVSEDGSERALTAHTLPLGLLGHRLLRAFREADAEARETLCSRMLGAARSRASVGAVREIRIEEVRWDALRRRGDRPAALDVSVIGACR